MNDTQEPRPRKRTAAAGLVALGLLAGGILAGSQIANAAGSSSSSNSSSSGTSNEQGQRGTDPAEMRHGPDEKLVTGTTAAKLEAAALKEVPGATVIRVETDSGDAAYEVHLQKADGTFVTVLFDKQLEVTGTEEGFGSCPGGMDGRHGGPNDPAGTGSSSGSGSSSDSGSGSTN